MAMDNAIGWAGEDWAGGGPLGQMFSEGLAFPGYPYLSELAQRPEYRTAVEIISTEMTRKWVKFSGKGTAHQQRQRDRKMAEDFGLSDPFPEEREEDEKPDTSEKQEKIAQLEEFLDNLHCRDAYRTMDEKDGYFGRGHLFHEIAGNNGSTPEGREELQSDIGIGVGDISRSKVNRDNPLTRLKVVEPVWMYPTTYNAMNPLMDDFYSPTVWYMQGIPVHASRMFTQIGRPVPDLLKPAYSFGGLSLTQIMQPYVNIWLETRESIGRLIHAFSVMVLMTDLQTMMQPGGGAALMERVNLFNTLRDNNGTFVLNKNTEDFKNVAVPLSGLHELQAQAQEHLCSVIRAPVAVYTGISPTGLNASSEGEIRIFENTIHACQESRFRRNLTKTINFAQLSLWNEVDPDIVFEFVQLRELTEKEEAELRKLDAETDDLLMNGCQAISPEEVRIRVAGDDNGPHAGIDPDDLPEPPQPPPGEVGEGGEFGRGEGGGEKEMPGQPKPGGRLNISGREAYTGVGEGAGDDSPFAHDAEWRESDHPRAPDGKFGTGSGGAAISPRKPATVESVSKKVGVSEAYRTSVRKLIKESSDPDEKIKLAELVAESLAAKYQKLKGLGRHEEAAETYRKVTKADLAISNMKRVRAGHPPEEPETSAEKKTRKSAKAKAVERLTTGFKGRLKAASDIGPMSYSAFLDFMSMAQREAGATGLRKLAEGVTGQKFTNNTKAIAALDQYRVQANEAGVEKRRAEIKQNVLDVAKKQGFPQDKVEFTDETHEFELNGVTYKAAGTAHIYTDGKIRIYMNQATPGFAKQLMSHEVMHIKFEDYLTKSGWRPSVEDNDKIKQFEASDGVTGYSQEYWAQYRKNPSSMHNLNMAFHETLAEIAAMEERGLTVGAPEWRSLYDEVNSHWSKGRATA
jgi:hypothetical protein